PSSEGPPVSGGPPLEAGGDGRNTKPLASQHVLSSLRRIFAMARSAAVTFKGTPMTLAGEAVKVGQQAPDFTLHYFEGGLKTVTPAHLQGKRILISVVPSLDTGVCAIQTEKFNEQIAALGDKVNAVTVSLD